MLKIASNPLNIDADFFPSCHSKEGKAVRVSVEVGDDFEDLVQVKGELQLSDVVAVRGNERLRDGQVVTVQDSSPTEVPQP